MREYLPDTQPTLEPITTAFHPLAAVATYAGTTGLLLLPIALLNFVLFYILREVKKRKIKKMLDEKVARGIP